MPHVIVKLWPGKSEEQKRRLFEPTDAVISLSATCICGSDLWPYRGIQPIPDPVPMGHEYCGIVEDVGRDVRGIKPGQFVIGSFLASDSTCPHCPAGYQTSCAHKQFVGGAQAPADGTQVAHLLHDRMGAVELLLDEVGVQPRVRVPARHGNHVGAITRQRLRAEFWCVTNRSDASQGQPVGAANLAAEGGAVATCEALRTGAVFVKLVLPIAAP